MTVTMDAYDEMYSKIYELIISDIMMPEIDGFEFAESVRRVNKQIPILFISAKYDLPFSKRRVIEMPCNLTSRDFVYLIFQKQFSNKMET